MTNPKVSVIIPTYNGAIYLGEAIQSVLNQSYHNFEIVVVDDASPDHTTEVVSQFNDSRLIYIIHKKNQGADKARNTALQASNGEIISFLDQDDFFHPEKLDTHVTFLQKHPEIGLTYNARFELNYSSKTIRDLSWPPHPINLADLVLWFPLSPSDVVLKREWALQMDLVHARRGAEIAHFGGLFLSGCKFASVDRALNYRRYHSGRTIKHLSSGCESELYNQAMIFSDPRCPAELMALRNIANANIYMYWAYLAFAQDETALGQNFAQEAARRKPSILRGIPCELVNNILINCIDDENQNHEDLLRRIFAQFPAEMAPLSEQYGWAVGQGYLLKGVRAVIWNRRKHGYRHFERASKLEVRIDDSFLSKLIHQLLNYEREFGAEAAQNVLCALAPFFETLAGQAGVRRVNGSYSANRAFYRYQIGDYARVPNMILNAISNNPKYLTNRGLMVILGRSILRL